MSGTTNLRILKPSRKKLRAGDIFRLSPRSDLYLFGRVISTEAIAGSALTSLNLVYIYRSKRSDDSIPSDQELSRSNLLIQPVMTNRLPWSRGYFENVAYRPLRERERLRVHCFRDSRGRYFDELGRRLRSPTKPVGERGVHSFRTIDDLVSDALGITLAPEP